MVLIDDLILPISAIPNMLPPTIVLIPATGGVISFQGNLSFSVLIPNQFFNSTQTVTVTMLDETAIQANPKILGSDREAQIAGPIFEIGASSSFSSNASATLFLPYRSAKSKRGDETFVFRIYYFDEFDDIWIPSKNSADDKDSLSVSTNTSHFSLWTVISTKKPLMQAVEAASAAVDWRLALYIGLPCLGLLLIFFVARLIHAKHKHVQNSKYEFCNFRLSQTQFLCIRSDCICNQCSEFNKKMLQILKNGIEISEKVWCRGMF